ncbi:MAG: Asp23/Gls24 family envelope stress response protein [Lachnospiraceae bacterium]|nr:Asp23/Gls24 family envelope stress response protein [Lachnospiraceae bacterium]
MEAQTRDKIGDKSSLIGHGKIGAVKIADDVVAMIAALAALEVDGVSSMAGGVKSDAVEHLSRSRLSRCVKVTLNQTTVRCDLSIMLEYGYNIPATSSKVQTRVKTAIENMTGLKVAAVNVRISEIAIPAGRELQA